MFSRFLALTFSGCALAAILHAAPIAPLIGELNDANHETRQTARLALRQSVLDAPTGDRAALEQELLKAIGPEQAWATRDWCLRVLELVGSPAAVPSLVRLLDDPDARIRDLARRALAAIPSNRALDALAEAALRAPDGEREAYVDALAYRASRRAVKPLTTLMQAGSPEAAQALGRIGTAAARSALKKAHEAAEGTLKGSIELALLDAGLKDRRLAARLAESGQTTTIQAGAFSQLTALDTREAARLLDAILANPDEEQRASFLREAMSSRALRDKMIARLPKLPETDRIVVLGALADLNLATHERAALNLLDEASETLLPVVVRTLGEIGTDASFQPLLDRYLADPRDRAVTTALARLKAPSADRRLFATARGEGAVADRVASLRLLVLRNTDGAIALLNDFGGPGHPPELRNEAFRGLEVVGDLDSVRLLLQVVLNDDPLKRAAQGSLKRLSANLGVADALWNECYAPALAAAANDDRRRDVLVIIDGISGPAAAAWLQQVVLDKQPLEADALNALRRWTDISGIDAWVAIGLAKNSTAEVVATAKESILRILGSTRTTGLNDEKVQRAAKAMRAFSDDSDFRREILASYSGELHWQTRMEITRLFPEFLSDPAIADDVQELLSRSRFN